MNGEFTAIVEVAEEGGFWASCPEVAGANGQGESREEAKENLREAIQLLDEAAWVYEAALRSTVSPEKIERWADEKIMAIDPPPYWLIELSSLKSRDSTDYAAIIRPQMLQPLTTGQRIALVAAAFERQLIDFKKALRLLFQIWIPRPSRSAPADFPEPIADLLSEEDCCWDMPREDFEARCAAALAEHLQSHERRGERPFLPS